MISVGFSGVLWGVLLLRLVQHGEEWRFQGWQGAQLVQTDCMVSGMQIGNFGGEGSWSSMNGDICSS